MDDPSIIRTLQAYLQLDPSDHPKINYATKVPTLHYLAELPVTSDEGKELYDKIVKLVISTGYDVNTTIDHYVPIVSSFSALHAAVAHNNIPLLDCLIQNGASTATGEGPSIQSTGSPGSWGSWEHGWLMTPKARRLLQKATKSGYATDRLPVLHLAVLLGRTEVMSYLLQKKIVDPNECLQRLSDAIVPVSEEMDFPPLILAIKTAYPDLVGVFLAHQNVKLQLTYLDYCIKRGYLNFACMMTTYLSNNELANHKIGGNWALHELPWNTLAYTSYCVEKMMTLINRYVESGWDVNSMSKSSQMADYSTRDNDAKLLYNCRILSDWRLPELSVYQNFLHIAVTHGNKEMVQLIRLLVQEMGVNVNSKTEGDKEFTPLQLAIIGKQWDIVQCLIEMGADPNILGGYNLKDVTKMQPERLNAVQLLLRLGYVEWEGSFEVLEKMLEKMDASMGIKEFQLAVLGKNSDLILRVIQSSNLKEKRSEDTFWVNVRKSTDVTSRLIKIPSLLYLFTEYFDIMVRSFTRDLQIPTKICVLMKTIVEHGYDCNLAGFCEDEDVEENDPALTKLMDPLIFRVLEFDSYMRSNQLLATLLEFEHVNLNVRNADKKNPVEYVISLLPKCDTINTQCHRRSQRENKLEAMKMLLEHGADVSGMEIGGNWIYHPGDNSVIQLLCQSGAIVRPHLFKQRFCCIPPVRPMNEDDQLEKMKKWKKNFDEEAGNGLNLERLCRLKIRKSASIGLFRMQVDAIPELLQHEVLGVSSSLSFQ